MLWAGKEAVAYGGMQGCSQPHSSHGLTLRTSNHAFPHVRRGKRPSYLPSEDGRAWNSCSPHPACYHWPAGWGGSGRQGSWETRFRGPSNDKTMRTAGRSCHLSCGRGLNRESPQQTEAISSITSTLCVRTITRITSQHSG